MLPCPHRIVPGAVAAAVRRRRVVATQCPPLCRAFTPSRPALKRRWFAGLFSWRKRAHPTDQGGAASGRMTLFHQDDVPDDLKLPTPADPVARTAAGGIDAAVAAAGGAIAGWAAFGLTGDGDAAAATAAGAATALWVLRDGLADEGNRSLGKAAMGVEVAYWDGALASPAHALARNAIVLVWPLAGLHPILEMVWTTAVVFDVASLFLTSDARKLGDYAMGTRVVTERAGRAGRVRDRADALEMARVRAQIDALAPGLLASPDAERLLGVPAATHEEVQRQLVARATAEAHEIATRLKADAAADAARAAAPGDAASASGGRGGHG